MREPLSDNRRCQASVTGTDQQELEVSLSVGLLKQRHSFGKIGFATVWRDNRIAQSSKKRRLSSLRAAFQAV